MKSLKEENRTLREEKMAESLSSQAIIESLEELVHEQKEDHEIMMQKLSIRNCPRKWWSGKQGLKNLGIDVCH